MQQTPAIPSLFTAAALMFLPGRIRLSDSAFQQFHRGSLGPRRPCSTGDVGVIADRQPTGRYVGRGHASSAAITAVVALVLTYRISSRRSREPTGAGDASLALRTLRRFWADTARVEQIYRAAFPRLISRENWATLYGIGGDD